MTDCDQIDNLATALEAKLNKRPNCSKCNDDPRLVDHCQHCGGSGLEPQAANSVRAQSTEKE